MNTRFRRLVIIILCFLMIIPNNTLAQTAEQSGVQNQREMKYIFNWAKTFLSQLLHSEKNITTIDKSGIYEFGTFNGTIIITEGNVTLKDTELLGNLIISENVKNEEITIENVNINGNTIIYGENVIINFYGKLKELSVLADRMNFQLKRGTIENIIISKNGMNATINLYENTEVRNLLVESKSDIMGKGIIKKAIIKVSGVKIEQIPEVLEQEKGIILSVGYNFNKKSKRSSKNNNPADNEIVDDIMKDLKIEVQNPAGRKVVPKIALPNTDQKYHANITWKSENSEFVAIKGSEAIIYRRGINNSNNSHEHEGENDKNINSMAVNAVSLMGLDNISINSEADHEDGKTGHEECGGIGGNITLVVLTATVSKGQYSDTKTFNVCIPWGWGKAITILENGSGGHEHVESAPIPKVIPKQTLYIGQYPLVFSSEDLALYGEKISKVECETLEITTGSAITQDFGEKTDVTTTSSIVGVEIIDKSLLKITPIEKGRLIIKAVVENSLGKSEASFVIKVEDPIAVDNSAAVAEAVNHLKPKMVSNGKGPKQTNKIILPNTDYLGYGTAISWESNNEKFISIDGEKGIIYRRGSENGGGGCHDKTKMLISSDFSASCDGGDGHDDGGCGGSSGQGGKSTIVELKATIVRGDLKTIKTIVVKIPWGWGRPITLSYK